MVVALLDDEHLADRPAVVFGRRFFVWTFLSCVAGGPSLLIAWSLNTHKLAMLVGILIFALLLTLATSTESFNRLKRQPAFRKAIRITFGFRVALSVFFPFGWIPDFIAGYISVAVGGDLIASGSGNWDGDLFLQTLVVTLIQGSILLAMLLFFMMVVYGFIPSNTPVPLHLQFICIHCGYNLRGSGGHGVCPECGKPAPPGGAPGATGAPFDRLDHQPPL